MPMNAQPLPKVCYEIFIRSFCDSNRDGIGDLNGITSKLDYLQDLGIEAIWITPFVKSDSYHKYDTIDYLAISSEYGTLDDFKNLVNEAHKRNIKIIFDFVINHTSDKHFWFQEARKGKDNPYRDYYLWMTPQKIDELGIAVREKTADTWETQPWHWAKDGDDEKYYGVFWKGMPDLNMDNPKVREEIYKIGKFWIDLGVDGFRMDAAKHIYPVWESEKNHGFWREFRQRMESVKPDIYIVGEVWTSPENIAPYFGGLKANFDFDLCFAIQNMVKSNMDSVGIIKYLLHNYPIFAAVNPHFIDATMLSNHDQDRIGSVANNDINKMKMAANLLLTLPGNPFIYYGEEIGMLGKKPDEGIREAFLWDIRRKDKFRTNWQKPKYNTDSKVMPLQLQMDDENSIYHHYKNLITLRNKNSALNQISPPNLSIAQTANENCIVFIREDENQRILIIQNIKNEPIEVDIIEDFKKILFQTNEVKIENKKARLNPYSLLVLDI